MSPTILSPTERFLPPDSQRSQRSARLLRVRTLKERKRQIVIATIVGLFHLSWLQLAKRWPLSPSKRPPLSIQGLTKEDLKQIKDQIRKSPPRPAVLQNEMDPAHRVDTAPEDAAFIGAFNQKFEKQQVARAQSQAPQPGRPMAHSPTQPQKPSASAEPHNQAPQRKSSTKTLKLSDLGIKLSPLPSRTDSQKSQRFPEAASRQSSSTSGGIPMGRKATGIAEGDENFLNTVESVFFSFFSRFEEQVSRNWHFLLAQRRGELNNVTQAAMGNSRDEREFTSTIFFEFNPQGELLQIQVRESSGLPLLDQICVQAIANLRNLPNPPKGLFEHQPTYRTELSFTYIVRPGGLQFQGLQY